MRQVTYTVCAVLAGILALVIGPSADAYPSGTKVIQSVLETPGTGVAGDDADDPAIWVDVNDPSQSLVIVNAKKSKRLFVYDLQGRLVQTIYDRGVFYGNVDVRGDWVVAAHNGIAVFKVVDHRLVPAMEATGNATTAGEGLCLWQHDGTVYVVNNVKGSFRVRVHALTDADSDGLLQTQKPIFDWYQPSEGESCVVDDATSTLYVSEEDRGIWAVDLLSTGKVPSRSMLIPVSSNLTPDIEGLQIVDGLLIASAQNGVSTASKQNWLAIFDQATGQWLRNVRVGDGPTSDDCDQTDGIAAATGYFNDAFPAGLFVCQDGFNDAPGSTGTQNFKFARLDELTSP